MTPLPSVDFAADWREEVIQYIYKRYGEGHVAMACTLVTFRARSAVRDVARVLGLPPAVVERLTGALDVGDADSVEKSRGPVEAFGANPSTSLRAGAATGSGGRGRAVGETGGQSVVEEGYLRRSSAFPPCPGG